MNPARMARIDAALARRLSSVIAVAESVRRRHNMSAILRTCESFGIHEVHLITAGFRVSPGAARGAERWVERRRFDTTAASITDLRARGFRVYVADLLPGAFTPEDVPVDLPLAVVFGSEVRGVSPEARTLADGAVRIPMIGLTHSLNVSVSAAIILRTIAERRRTLLGGGDLPADVHADFLARALARDAAARKGHTARTTP